MTMSKQEAQQLLNQYNEIQKSIKHAKKMKSYQRASKLNAQLDEINLAEAMKALQAN